MGASVRIEAAAFSDTRFKVLARLRGFQDADLALLKCARIWAYQTEMYTPEHPTYVVPTEVIEAELGPGAGDDLVTARLAEREPTGFRIKGSKGRIEWLWSKRNNGKKGGRPAKSADDGEGKPTGSGSVPVRQTENEPTPNPPSPSPSPSPSPDPQTQNPESASRDARCSPRKRQPRLAIGTELEAPSGQRLVTDAWNARYSAANDGAKPTWKGKNGSLLSSLRAQHDDAEILRRMAILFDGKGPHWISPTSCDFGQFHAHFDKLASPQSGIRAGPHGRTSSTDLLEWQLRRVREAEEAEERGEEPPP
jgi:hypothetical protein